MNSELWLFITFGFIEGACCQVDEWTRQRWCGWILGELYEEFSNKASRSSKIRVCVNSVLLFFNEVSHWKESYIICRVSCVILCKYYIIYIIYYIYYIIYIIYYIYIIYIICRVRCFILCKYIMYNEILPDQNSVFRVFIVYLNQALGFELIDQAYTQWLFRAANSILNPS